MSTLFDRADLNKHDLPPRWDGVPVTWGPWQSPRVMFICPPPPPDPCAACGLIRPRAEAVGKRTSRFGRYSPLYAFRCTHCGHDVVDDQQTGELWDLEPGIDYGDWGSKRP